MTANSKGKNFEESKSADLVSDGRFPVVGLGASAGGIHALKEFFSQVPIDSGIAYVVILHMSPKHESRLAEILQVSSAMPVTQVTEQVRIEPNHVYVIPPNRNLLMQDRDLALTEMTNVEERRSPVDTFFRALAEATQERAISVILSGTGANGSMGIKRIKEHGGVAFVQEPGEAEFSDMPQNAIATGMVDYVLPVAQIPERIISYKEHLASIRLPEVIEEGPKTDEQALLDIFTRLRVRTGHDFFNYKRGTILRRIERRLGLHELHELNEYALYLHTHPEEVEALLKDLLISVTNFFRDQESIEALASQVIPEILKNKNPDDQVRVWVAGCATGEEAYSIAMLFAEQATSTASISLQMFATDLDQSAIRIAREGFYAEAEVADVSVERLRRFCSQEGDGFRIRRELRESILFAAHNVIKDPPFSHLDLISCRNLLIYLNRAAQSRVLEVLHFALNPSGYLFLGSSESIEGAGNLFTAVDKDHHIYRSRPVKPRHLTLPEITSRPAFGTLTEKERSKEEKLAVQRLAFADLHRRLLEEYGPPSVVVNEEYDIIHLSENAGRYLRIAGGEVSHNLLNLVRPDLRLELRSALYQAVHDRTNVEVRDLRVKTEEGLATINVLIRPVLRKEDVTRGFILVLFEEEDKKTEKEDDTQLAVSTEPISHRLEEELTHVKGQLRATVEQYEIQQEELRASNEELQAMNEELRTAAEELETSKEELQSLNEELMTVNQQLNIKIEELSQANNDFRNLMNSTSIGTIFLDRELRIKLFTPPARDVFNLIESDIGRSLLDITSQISQQNLVADVDLVLERLQAVQRELQTSSGRLYLMRITPYRTTDDRIEGVVITLVDITSRHEQELELRAARAHLENRVAERTIELEKLNKELRKENLERKRIETERGRLVSEIVSTQEDERRRIARDLHDQLGQRLTGLSLKLEALKAQIGKRSRVSVILDDLQSIVSQLDSDIDYLAWQLRPVALDDLGLPAVLSNYVKKWSEHSGIASEFRAGDFEHRRLEPRIETNLYRIAQEALNNCAKHSQCSRVDVLLDLHDRNAVLIVEDDGVGFDPEAEIGGEGHWGLIGIRERVGLLGGTLKIESAPKEGTTIFVRVPLSDGDGLV